MSNYFGKPVDEAIVDFQNEKDQEVKKKIFEQRIMPAFLKLCQYHYFKFPIAKNPDVVYEALTFLYEQIHKFNTKKFTRGFPYFNLVTKNFFIQKLKSEKKEVSVDKDFVSLNDATNLDSDDLIVDHIESSVEKREFLELFKKQLTKWKEKAIKEQERKVAEGLVHLFENADSVDFYQKKAIFFYLKEITGLNSKQIAVNLNKFYKKFKRFKTAYEAGEV